ncbi:MAG: DUF2723 domain-containing protein [Bacteroidota bacterium]
MNYRFLNISIGWFVFLVTTIVYFITIEDTVSLWDCGEYITAAYKLEVGHPPGAPLFMVLGRLFSFFAAPENVAVWINRMSALSSSLTILFMFWSISLLAKKLALRTKVEITKGDQFAIFGSALVGSLAYGFSDSFWFSAVEGEVYAMSSLFTAVIFWAILKWDEEMALAKSGLLSEEYAPNRWLLLIMFMLGLAIGVHLLGILVVPAMAYVIYFRTKEKTDFKGFMLTGILGVFILGFIQEGVIPGSVSLASSFEVAFKNSLGLPFYSGTIFFFTGLILLCVFLIRYSRRKKNSILYNATMGLILLLIGYGSFAVIVIRSNANPPLDENDPENLVTLHAYLKREQYGSAPLVSGPFWNSKENDPSLFESRGAFYLRRFVVSKGDTEVKAFREEGPANKYAKEIAGSVEEKYFESNAGDRENAVPTYAQTTFFPRMYWSNEQQRIDGYKNWSGYDPAEDKGTETGKDGMRLPTMGENLTYFFDYQVNWMYWRYFMWNFAGRQNDIQGNGDELKGNWLSGINFVDEARLGAQGDDAPYFTSENKTLNKFYFLPLVFGIIGIFFHFYRAPKDAFVVLLAFLFTGVAIVVYLNQKPFEPRERDYAFAASFYFFAFWIGLGVYALYEAFSNFGKKELSKIGIVVGAGLVVTFFSDLGSELALPTTKSWISISLIGLVLFGVMVGLKQIVKKDSQGAIVATILGLIVPIVMGVQGFDDHDRSLKTSARDLAHNYLSSCTKNGIIFTNGDNDTFPLWYMQEVEGERTDVRVCNLSLMQTDWYTEQMMMRAYGSDPLPIKFREDQIMMSAGNTDQVLFANLFEMFYINASEDIIKEIIAMRVKANKTNVLTALGTYQAQLPAILGGLTSTQPNVIGRLEEIKKELFTSTSDDLTNAIYSKYRNVFEILSGIQSGMVSLGEAQAQQLQKLTVEFEDSWNFTNLKEAMAFVRDDNKLVNYDASRKVRFFPSSGFILKVDKDNVVKSGLIKESQKKDCLDELRFDFSARGITREQVMMLDIIANNDWKRGIFFSSPGGSDVSVAFYQRGYIKQNGMAFELSPLKDLRNRYVEDKMYNNLMNVYHYGAMNNPAVLTDYYSRRHTAQFRLHFASLAEFYLSKGEEDRLTRQNLEQNIIMLKRNNMMEQATELENQLKSIGNTTSSAGDKEKALKLLRKSLAVMPANIVLDYGEPSASREKYSETGLDLPIVTDGILQDYVGMFYKAGANADAEKLGAEVARQLESIINYFVKSDAYFAGNTANNDNLFAALDAYFKIHLAAAEANPSGKLYSRTKSRLDQWYSKDFDALYDQLELAATEAGESVRSGKGPLVQRLIGLQAYLQAIGVHYGYLPAPKGVNAPAATPDMQNINLEQLMQQVQGDSVLK